MKKSEQFIKEPNLIQMKYIQFLICFTVVLLLPGRTKPQNQTAGKSILKIDFSQKNSPVQAGFQGFLADHEVANSFLPQTFQVEGKPVTIKVEWPNGTKNTTMQMIDRGGGPGPAMNDLLRDWVGTDGRVDKVPLILILNGLPEGNYEWVSYHHDNNDQTGIFNVKIEDANGASVKNGIDISNGNVPFENVTVFKTAINSNGKDIRFTFEMAAYPDNSASFFVMNGFSISIPGTVSPVLPVIPGKPELVSPLNFYRNAQLNPVLKWKKSTNADSYNVYLDTVSPPKLVGNVQITNFNTSLLSTNTTYYWSVEAVNPNGKAAGEIRSFTTKPSTPVLFQGKTSIEFSHGRNFYFANFGLELTTNNPGANIVYTLNGSKPSPENGKVYTAPVIIDSTLVVKAMAISEKDTSTIVTNTYLFPGTIARQGKNPPGFPTVWSGSSTIPADYEMDPAVVNNPEYSGQIAKALQSVPSVSLSMNIADWFDPVSGLYIGYPNSGMTREKPVTAEFLFGDTTKSFSVECGVQNQGGTSIVNWKVPKQSMRLLFKEMYGPKKLDFKLFQDSEIKWINTLVLDGLLYSWVHPFDDKQRNTSLYFRDQLASDMQNKMGWPSFHGIYVNLYINGLYWGIYDLHERPDEDFLEEYLDAPKEDFDIIKHNPGNIVQGSNTAYNEMLNLARKGLVSSKALADIQKYLDLPAFIDYMILNFYLGNFDWAHQNYYAARSSALQTGFRFYTWDAEHVMRYSDVNYNNLQKNDKGGPTEIHALLKQNEEYRLMFADAVYKHFFNDGALTPGSFEESFLFRKNEIQDAIILESARWGDFRKNLPGGVTYTKNEHWQPEVNKVLNEYIPKRRDIVINQMRADFPKLFPDFMPPVFSIGSQSTEFQQNIELTNPNTSDGDIYYTLDGSDPRLAGGIIYGTKYTKPISIKNSTLIKTRFLAKYSGIWSALAQKSFVFSDVFGKELVICEIMYHPENNYPEFIELVNSGETKLDIGGFVFSKGIDYTFQAGTRLMPGAGLVLTNDTALFRRVYGFAAFGQYNKQLNNKGELLILTNQFNQVVDSVSYSDSIPWPEAADGHGYSLQLANHKSDNALYSNWKLSDKKDGTPLKPGAIRENGAILYPNPFTDMVYIELGNRDLMFETFIVEVFDLYGSKIKTLELRGGNLQIKVPTRDLSQGVYVIQIKTKTESGFSAKSFKAIKL